MEQSTRLNDKWEIGRKATARWFSNHLKDYRRCLRNQAAAGFYVFFTVWLSVISSLSVGMCFFTTPSATATSRDSNRLQQIGLDPTRDGNHVDNGHCRAERVIQWFTVGFSPPFRSNSALFGLGHCVMGYNPSYVAGDHLVIARRLRRGKQG